MQRIANLFRISVLLSLNSCNSQIFECLLNVKITFGTALIKYKIILLTKLLPINSRHLSVILQIYFVSNHQKWKIFIFTWILPHQKYLLKTQQGIKTVFICHIIYQATTVSTSLEVGLHRWKSVLTC